MDKGIAIAVANSVLEHTGYIGTGAELVPVFRYQNIQMSTNTFEVAGFLGLM